MISTCINARYKISPISHTARFAQSHSFTALLFFIKEEISNHNCNHRRKHGVNQIKKFFDIVHWIKNCRNRTNDNYNDRNVFSIDFLENSPRQLHQKHLQNVLPKVSGNGRKTIIRSPTTPRPARREICAISEVPIPIAADIPIIYIQQLTSP